MGHSTEETGNEGGGKDPRRTEKGRQLWAATEAFSYGYGGVRLVSMATKFSRTTIHQGIKEIQSPTTSSKGRNRQIGGGCKKTKKKQPDLVKASK